MIRIAVGGAVEKRKIADCIEKYGGDKVTANIFSDIQAVLEVKAGKADYYFGSCTTGGGGALAMAISLLGAGKCCTVSMAGKPPDESVIDSAVKNGKIAFGFTSDDVEKAVRMLLNSIFKRGNK